MSLLDILSFGWQIIEETGDGDKKPDPIHTVGPQRVFTTQLVLTLVSGVFIFLLFCFLRYKWPNIYAVRISRQPSGSPHILQPLPQNLFGWIKVVYKITDEEIISCAGLDTYVYLCFFKMGIKIFFALAIMAIFILSPIRYHFTGNYDKDSLFGILKFKPTNPPDFNDDFPNFYWVYPVFTYIFSIVVYYYLYDFTNVVLRTRQKYLASQNSITDRTIRLDGIPKKLLQREKLKKFVEDLGIGKVMDVKLIYNWTPLEELLEKRHHLMNNLEYIYASMYKMDIDIYNRREIPAVNPIWNEPTDRPKLLELSKKYSEELINLDHEIKHMQGKFDSNLSTIDVKENQDFKQVPSAFVTMDSVASAQMAAQTILDPRVYKLMASLAPAPKDIIWENLKLTYAERVLKSYFITFVIVLSYGFIIFLVVPLTSLLDLKTISKFWPALGEFIGQSKWLTTFVTGILPPLLFTLLNVLFPYFYQYLSQSQGYTSNSDVELSTLLKNFFFIFFNLFLIYVAAGTFWDYISYISDTTKIPVQLATSLRRMALFYVDLILLQGLTMFPVKLLQVSDFFMLNILGKLFYFKKLILKTPRDYRAYYFTPQIFDFGINLPQHILIFMIILIYSVVSTKIVTCGLVYFVFGLFVYKYQLVYNFVHPPHSTGKVWPMIFRRVILGLIIFQLFMVGTLALESAIMLAVLCSPLIFVTILVLWNFEKYYVPLNTFIALRAILNPYDFDKVFDDDQLFSSNSNESDTSAVLDDLDDTDLDQPIDESSYLLGDENNGSSSSKKPKSQGNTLTTSEHTITRRKSTLDEEREQFTDYTYPGLIDPLDGPWIGFTGNFVSMIEYKPQLQQILEEGRNNDEIATVDISEQDLVVNKKLKVSEWE
ncbi:Calcium permeable stress-gated cation channel 1 [Candida viswanathii]|uniref:Calcium permeable stress-gated cation channel 1 n=1 Tax=Candida viswanathii TaxID=5486 RepID=A0A367Y470_9ASCO|nr:Calcium permeable stress-gated cation channel 1 [Candida viswanathii]